MVAFICAGISPLVFAQRQEERFVYDSMGKRNPFVPLTDPKSPTGIRGVFVPPEVEVKLPIEITLKGILWNGKEYFAIVNGEVIKQGEHMDNVKIKGIEKDKIILEYGEREFTVFLKKEKER